MDGGRRTVDGGRRTTDGGRRTADGLLDVMDVRILTGVFECFFASQIVSIQHDWDGNAD